MRDWLSRVFTRSTYARTTGDFLVNDPMGFPNSYPPIWWYGYDSGGGSTPIGPNGPYSGGAYSGVPVVTRATSLITGPLSAAPFRVMQPGPTVGALTPPPPRWVTDPMLTRPDERFPVDVYPSVLKLARGVFWASWIRSAIWYGHGAFLFTEDSVGGPVAGSLKLVDPLMLSTQREADGLHWMIGTGDQTVEADRDGRIRFEGITYRLVVLRNPHSDVDSEGLSLGVFAQYPTTFGTGRQIDSYTSGTFRSGIPAGYLKVETPGLDQDEATDLRNRWLENHGGDRRSIAVLNATTSFVPMNLSPVDAAVGEVKRLSIADVAFAFGLDPYTLGVSLANSATYNNQAEAWRGHRDFGLAPWIAAVQDTLSPLVSSGSSVTVNLDGFANPTAAERYAGYKVAIDAGVLTVDEARALEGLPTIEVEATAEGGNDGATVLSAA